MPRLALTGGAYQARSVIASAQRCLNLFAEPLPQQTGELSQFAHYPTPGTKLLGTLPQGRVRGIRQVTTGGIYAVAGSGVYKVDPTNWTATHLGDLTAGLHTPVSMSDNGNTLVIVDGTVNGWTVDLASDAFAAISDTAFYGATRVEFIDTFFVFNKPGTPQFYWSGSLATTFDPEDFINKEGFSDLLVTIAVAKLEIWLLGTRTTEIYYNAGQQSIADVQFQRQGGVFVDHGCLAKYSVATYDDAVYWLGCNRSGQGIVLAGQNYQTRRISTYAIEAHLATLSKIDDAVGFTYLLGGHAFYVLALPAADETWVYDITTGQWHEWRWLDTDGVEHRHRAHCCAYINGNVVVGDWQNGNLYRIDSAIYTDNGQPIKRQRSYPHIVNEMDRVFYRQFLADIESGNPAGEPTITTTTEKILTWLPQIAQLSVVHGNLVAPDWQRGIVYFADNVGYSSYSLTITTQPSPIASLTIPTLYADNLAVDPLSGFLLMQRDLHNGEPVMKLDPNTFATVASFGAETSFPSYPGSVWVSQQIVCIVCNGVSFGFLKYTVFSGVVSGFRVDTMQHSGFSQAIVSGSTDNRGQMCAGKSGGTAASVFLSYDATTTIQPSTPLYRIDIAASATAYDPATWPTTNPGITWTTVGTVNVSAVDPTWTGYTVITMGYDEADGNVIWIVGTQTGSQGYRVLKLNALTAAVMWNIATDTISVNLTTSHINGSLWMIRNPGAGAGPTTSYRIDTLSGTMVTQPISGFFASSGGAAQTSDSETALMFYGGSLTVGPNSAIPVSGTSSFSSGWAVMGGQTIITTTTTTHAQNDNLIWLDWSDDRGHSFGNPVSQPLGNRGEYLTSVQWQRLGYARDRVFRLTWSLPVATALQGAFVEADTSAKS